MNGVTAMLADYNTGQFTIKMISKKYGVSVGKTYYLLRDAGCNFLRHRRKPYTHEEWLNRSIAQKGKIITKEQRMMISERNSCNFNGMNGYGHTKKHKSGYVLVYVPKHPYDNRIENLKVMEKHEHMSMHMKERHSKRGSDLLTL